MSATFKRSPIAHRPAHAQIDVVFDAISAYREMREAVRDGRLSPNSAAYAAGVEKANVIFHAALKNLKARHGFTALSITPFIPSATTADAGPDITDWLVQEVRAVETQLARFRKVAA